MNRLFSTSFWLFATLALSACGGNGGASSSAANNSGAANSSAVSLTLNDTGTTFCRDSAGDNADCLVAPAQDGNNGRDSQTLAKQGAGPAGFDWSKLAQDGSLLANQKLAWQNTGSESANTQWSCVQDHHTGLRWEVKSNVMGSLNHRDLRYSWINSDANTNGGMAGTASTDDCNGSLCDTQAYVAALNTVNFCGHNNWRLPSLNELLSLVVTDNLDLVMDANYFPNAHNDQYWTYQSYAPDNNRAWYLYFSDGSFGITLKSSPNYLRLVSDSNND